MAELDEELLERLRRGFDLELDASGRLRLEGEEIAHAGIRRALRHGLDLTEAGEAIVRVGEQWAYLRAHDTLFRVRGVAADDAGLPRLILDDGRELPLDPQGLEREPARGLRVRVPTRFGRPAWARFTNSALVDLSAWLDPNSDGERLVFGDQRVELGETEPSA